MNSNMSNIEITKTLNTHEVQRFIGENRTVSLFRYQNKFYFVEWKSAYNAPVAYREYNQPIQLTDEQAYEILNFIE